MVGQFLVIGLGRFGRALALQLARQGQAVLAVDDNPDLVQQVAQEIDAAVVADATDEVALRELHPERMACAVVAIGMQSLEASILATSLLRQAGVPRIVARAVSPLHERVLRAVGADEIVNPEAEIAARLATRLVQPNVLDLLDLAEGVEFAEIALPASFIGKSLVSLDMRRRHGISVVALRRGEKVKAGLTGEETLESGDMLVVIGSEAAVRKVAALA